ncbi:uncharacterized protein LOC102299890 isoform X1 [Haplochromis burtoni]|uniref:uncharacterized protein LOC102299890 isoform X1 n=1 Tax=Haplochromis burtoni TaxID=8153 RepID=UPI0003BCE9FB|nr:uncharacterized protein LOC102299890 isoform X1 [Haplochromis burtoni]
MASGEHTVPTTISNNTDQALEEESSQEQQASQEQSDENTTTSTNTDLEDSSQEEIQEEASQEQRVKHDIVILIDSNGKFINEKKLFPRHKVFKVDCPNTQKAIQILSEEDLGTPSIIIIHTGCHQLRREQDRLSESLKRVIEKASNTFPESRVVMSALLPVRNMHPDTINKINTKLEKECESLPQIHFAKHHNLDVSCLYDNIHLSKDKVHIFARTLKDVALERYPSTLQTTVPASSSIKNFYFYFH